MTRIFLLGRGEVNEEQWDKAAAVAHQQFRRGDLIVSTPLWTDPLMRWKLGDLLSLSDAGYSELKAYNNLWVLSVAGSHHELEPKHSPSYEKHFASLTLKKWPLRSIAPRYDFFSHISEAEVSLGTRPCRWNERGGSLGGGLNTGPLRPERRFQCSRAKHWLWVGQTVIEDLELKARACIWQHPDGPTPIRSTFPSVLLSDRLVFYGGLYYMHERDHAGPPLDFSIEIAGVKVADFVHRDGEGWKRYLLDTHRLKGNVADVTVSVSAKEPHLRTFCWTGFSEEK
ncbi:MAG: hypothetical protein IPJ88_02290 [Myxococcales bacterium]|nr:MAG: hypothetical protein IPJ88_02290 [Myxococcales bacterium]